MNRNRLGFAALAIVAGSTGAFAQDATTGAIIGTVRDTGGAAIARATVVIESNRGQLTYRTDADGQFRAASLIPGRYSVTVSAEGYQTTGKLAVDVSLNLRTPLTVKLVKTGGAVVEVVASASRVDTTTQTSGTNFSSDTIQSLPLGRSFLAAVNLAPGVVDGGGTGTSNPSISGSSGLENQYLVDGVNTTSTGFGANGAYSRTYGSLGTGINSDFIQEVQVKSFGLDAEYGSALGGVVSAITRSGDNTFSGTAFLYLDIDSLQARDKVADLAAPSPLFNSRNRTELGFTVSGPIIKDKLFYFVGFNPITNETKRTAPSDSDFAGRQSTEKTQNNSYYAKLNWLMGTNHSMEFSFFGDPGKRAFGPQGNGDYYVSEIGWSELKYGGRSASVKYNGSFGNDFFVEARVSDRSQEFQRIIDSRANAGWFYSDSATGIPLNPNAVGRYEKKLEDTNRQYEIKLTKAFGNFELKAGYLLENIGYDSAVSRSGPSGFSDPHRAGAIFSSGISVDRRYMRANNALPFGANNVASYYRITRGNITPEAIKTDTDYSAYFIQGTYNHNNRLYIKAGVRFDEQTLKGSDINYKFKASDNIAPRISVTWDPAGDGKSKIYGFFGRYYEKVPNDIAVRSLSAEVGVSRSDFRTFDTVNFNSLTNPILDGTSVYDVDPETGESTTDGEATTTHFLAQGSFLTRILPGTKAQYLDEYVVGYDSTPFEGATLSHRLIYRNVGRVLEDMGIDGGNNLPYYIGNPGENGHLLEADALTVDPTLAGSGNKATWPKPVRRYYAIESELTVKRERWNGFLNLRLSRLEGNYEGLYRNDNGQQDPNISSLYDFSLEYLRVSEAHAGRGLKGDEHFASGPLPTDRALVINAGLVYIWTPAFTTGVLFRGQTGTPLSAFYGLVDYDNAGELASGGRGAYGRTPTTRTWDLTAKYTFKFAGRHQLALQADIFNVLNRHEVTQVDQNVESAVGVTNPDYTKPLAYQTARQVRLGLRYSF